MVSQYELSYAKHKAVSREDADVKKVFKACKDRIYQLEDQLYELEIVKLCKHDL
jgi:hypothetical protein